jgi:Ca-activated chloride channel family protein
MKETFDRHQEKLTPAERHAIWRKISPSPAREPRTGLRWGLATSAAVVVVAVVTFSIWQDDLMAPRQSMPGSGDVTSLHFERTPVTDNQTGAGAGRVQAGRDEGQSERVIAPYKELESPPVADREKLPADVGAPVTEETRPANPAPSPEPLEGKVGQQVIPMEVQADRLIDKKTSTTKQSVRGDAEVTFKLESSSRGIAGSQAPPPVIPITGGTHLPNDEPYDAMYFEHAGVNPFITTDEDALSTFAVDVDAASYTITRRYIELGHLPPKDAVRVEEFVNFFPQGYPDFENEDFRILVDGAPSPFGTGYHLLRVGLKGREISQRERKPAQLTFVVDISGSMNREDRLGLVKRSLRLLVDELRDDDRIGIVVYGSQGRVLLEPTAIGESSALRAEDRSRSRYPSELDGWRTGRQRILAAIDRLEPGGSTNAEEGLLLAYEMARREFRPEWINRLVLCSDGVANVGRTGPGSILERVRTEADRGIYLSTVGFGMGNYNDVLMEQLANDADGNYYYVDDLTEARRVFVENLTGTLQTIAKDAKIQVEFHPSQVLRYRLLGFENRDVADRDFRNDKVDAGEIGAGHEVTALYEVKLADDAKDGPIATVRFRYARPEHDGGGAPEVREMKIRFNRSGLSPRFEQASARFRLDAAVAEFAEILRGSYWARESQFSNVLPVARSAARDLREDTASEFVRLVEQAAELSRMSP